MTEEANEIVTGKKNKHCTQERILPRKFQENGSLGVTLSFSFSSRFGRSPPTLRILLRILSSSLTGDIKDSQVI